MEELFEEFEEVPVASGSIGQVYQAKLSAKGARNTGIDPGSAFRASCSPHRCNTRKSGAYGSELLDMLPVADTLCADGLPVCIAKSTLLLTDHADLELIQIMLP